VVLNFMMADAPMMNGSGAACCLPGVPVTVTVKNPLWGREQ
jgi:hypothetical protein